MADPISSKNKMSGGCLAVFFSIFLIAGCAFLFFAFLKPAWKSLQAQSWVQVPCTIMSSQVKSHRSSDGTSYSVDIRFRYYYDDREYESDSYDFMEMSTGGRSGKRAIVKRYPSGLETACYVNPDDPSEAVIYRGFSTVMWFALIPLVFIVVGGGGMYFSLRKKKDGPTTETISEYPGKRWVGKGKATPVGDRTGPVTLKPRATPLGKFIAFTFFALFWNGIVSVFLWQVIKAWSSGRGSWMEKWFLPIFLIPFVLIGLFLIGMAFHSLLAIFNPRTRLTLSSATVGLGESVNVQWGIVGRAAKLTKLQIYVEGREEATYRRGTNTHTDKRVFETIDIATLTSKTDIRSGQQTVEIPADTMHSFDASSNKIIWSIHLKGEIPKWPDVDDEYPLEVVPVKKQA